MKYLSLLPLAGLAFAAPGAWDDSSDPKKTTTEAAKTWDDADVSKVTSTVSAKVTYCPESGKLTKDKPDGNEWYEVKTITVTKTEGGKGGDKTVTVTKTEGGKGGDKTVTVTKTETEKGGKPTGKPGHEDEDEDEDDKPPKGGKCLSDEGAKKIVDNFRDLLEFTSYNGTKGAPGRGYHFDVSAATLAEDFVDISDSINFMAGFPLGSVTFKDKKSFDYGQGVLQPEVLTETLNIFHDCKSITWRWKLTPKIPKAYPVVGINYMQINDKGLIQKNYAEFNDGAWLESFGQKCALNPVKVTDGEWAKRV